MALASLRKVGGARYLVVRGDPPAARRLEAAAERGLGVLVEELDGPSLEWLRPVAHSLTRLIIADQAPRDVRVIERMTALAELGMWAAPTERVDLTGVPLRSFAGRAHPALRSITDCPGLESLLLTTGGFEWAERMPRLRSLTLNGLPGDAGVPTTPVWWNSIASLSVHGRARLDIASVGHLPGLQELTLAGFSAITHADALALSESLSVVQLEDLGDVQPPGVVGGIGARRLRVVGTQPWIRREFGTARKVPRTWSLPPWLRSSGASDASDEEDRFGSSTL